MEDKQDKEEKPKVDPNAALLAGMPTSKYLKKGFHSNVLALKNSCEKLSAACFILAICYVVLNMIIFIGSKGTKASMGLLPFDWITFIMLLATIITGIGAIGGVIYVYKKHGEKQPGVLTTAFAGLGILVLYIIIHQFIIKIS